MEEKSRARRNVVMNESAREPEADRGNWTLALRRSLEHRFPLVNLLPHRQPYFVASWVYVFGVVAIAALLWIVATGVSKSTKGTTGTEAASRSATNIQTAWIQGEAGLRPTTPISTAATCSTSASGFRARALARSATS